MQRGTPRERERRRRRPWTAGARRAALPAAPRRDGPELARRRALRGQGAPPPPRSLIAALVTGCACEKAQSPETERSNVRPALAVRYRARAGYRAVRDTVPCGIPCCAGYRAVRDTTQWVRSSPDSAWRMRFAMPCDDRRDVMREALRECAARPHARRVVVPSTLGCAVRRCRTHRLASAISRRVRACRCISCAAPRRPRARRSARMRSTLRRGCCVRSPTTSAPTGQRLLLRASAGTKGAHPAHTCTLTPATSAPGLGSPRPHLHRDSAHPAHTCSVTGHAPATSAPELGSPLPHLQGDRPHLCPHLPRDRAHAGQDWTSLQDRSGLPGARARGAAARAVARPRVGRAAPDRYGTGPAPWSGAESRRRCGPSPGAASQPGFALLWQARSSRRCSSASWRCGRGW
jgi:hypothetical protein